MAKTPATNIAPENVPSNGTPAPDAKKGSDTFAQLGLRFTEAEHTAVMTAFRASGLPTVQDYVRSKLGFAPLASRASKWR